MSIPRSKKPQRSKALPKPERVDGPCCYGCGCATDSSKAKYVIPALFGPDIIPTEYCCSKACWDVWCADHPSQGSKTKAKWA